jgi:hypothetical protein
MYDKLKRVFAGKPWTQGQIAKWERTRSKGRTTFVSRFALWWGTMMVVMLSLGLHYLNGAPLDARVVLLDALIAYPLGILLGFSIWSGNESKYSERFNAK